MKAIPLALLAAGALAGTALRADSRFSIGIHVGVPVYRPVPPVVVHTPPPPVVVYAPARGYWKDVVVKTWVPDRWVVTRDRWGRTLRHREPGYFTFRTERVWVDGRDHCPPAVRPGAFAHHHHGR